MKGLWRSSRQTRLSILRFMDHLVGYFFGFANPWRAACRSSPRSMSSCGSAWESRWGLGRPWKRQGAVLTSVSSGSKGGFQNGATVCSTEILLRNGVLEIDWNVECSRSEGCVLWRDKFGWKESICRCDPQGWQAVQSMGKEVRCQRVQEG